MKMSPSLTGGPRSGLVGSPVPDAEAWKAMFLLSGDQVAELPRIRNICSSPLVFITNRSEVLIGPPSARFRLLSNTIFFPSGDNAGKLSVAALSVSRLKFAPSGLIRWTSVALFRKGLSTGLSRELVNAIVDSSANPLLDSPARNPARQETNTSAIAVKRMNIVAPPWYERTAQKRPARIEFQYCARRPPERNVDRKSVV